MFFTVELILIGVIAGIVSGLIGVGGGFIFVPLLTLIGVPMRSAAGLSLLFVACAATTGAVSHWRQGTGDLVVAAVVIPGALITVPVGSYWSGVLPNSLLEMLFGSFVLVAALALYWQSIQQKPFPGAPVVGSGLTRPAWIVLRRAKLNGAEYRFPVNLLRGFAVGGTVGLIAGLLGVGGGALLVVLLILVVGLPAPLAAGTSLLCIVIPSLAGAITHLGLGHIDAWSAIPAVLAGILGAFIGAKGTLLLSASRLQSVILWLLILVAVYMIGRGII